jgi:hypothetical protein
MKQIAADTYHHNFGIVIPMKTNVLWEQQTGGVSCNHVKIEGVYITLDYPGEYKWYSFLDELQNRNYKFKSTKDIWKKIKKQMPFEYEEIDAPKNQPFNQEGLQWIRVTKIKGPEKEDLKRYKGKDRQDEIKRVLKDRRERFGALIGRKIALIYPNCD